GIPNRAPQALGQAPGRTTVSDPDVGVDRTARLRLAMPREGNRRAVDRPHRPAEVGVITRRDRPRLTAARGDRPDLAHRVVLSVFRAVRDEGDLVPAGRPHGPRVVEVTRCHLPWVTARGRDAPDVRALVVEEAGDAVGAEADAGDPHHVAFLLVFLIPLTLLELSRLGLADQSKGRAVRRPGKVGHAFGQIGYLGRFATIDRDHPDLRLARAVREECDP